MLNPSLKGTRTEDNLKAAFALECQTVLRYLFFARKADIEGFSEVAAVFRSAAEGEIQHAEGHLGWMEAFGDPVTGMAIGDTVACLSSAISGETAETSEGYPEMALAAREEELGEIAEWFETLARAERQHAERFRRALEDLRQCSGSDE
jgi:rubrerythrin